MLLFGMMLYLLMWLAILAIMGGIALWYETWQDAKRKNAPPIVISDHVKAIGMDYPEYSFIRINLAWVHSVKEVEEIIKNRGDHKIYLDYPTGRTKPPMPTMSLQDAQYLANKYADHIEYFAFSNAWDAVKPSFIREMRSWVDKRITLVPKIETKGGVKYLKEIVEAAQTNIVMLDAEDLYVHCEHNPKVFNKYKKICRQRCKELGVMCIELKGVVFGYE